MMFGFLRKSRRLAVLRVRTSSGENSVDTRRGVQRHPGRRKMRYGNPRGTQIRKLWGKIYLFVSTENSALTDWCLRLKCFKTHLQAPFTSKLSPGMMPSEPHYKGREKKRRGMERGDVASWLSGGWTPMVIRAEWVPTALRKTASLETKTWLPVENSSS